MRYVKNKKKYNFREIDPKVAAQILTKAIVDSTDELAAVASKNAEQYLQRTVAETAHLVEAAGSQILDMYKVPGMVEELIETLLNADKMVDDFANATDSTMTARAIAEQLVEAAIPAGVKASAKATKRQAKAVKEGKGLKEAKEARVNLAREEAESLQEASKKNMDDVYDSGARPNDVPEEGLFEEALENRILDVSSKMQKEAKTSYVAFGFDLLRLLDPLNKWFNRTWGMNVKEHNWAARMFNSVPKIAAYWTGQKLNAVKAIANNPEYTPEVMQKALANLRRGVKNEKNAVVKAAQTDIEGVISDIIGISAKGGDSILGNVFLRTGAGIAHIEKILTSYLGRNADNIVSTKGNSLFDLDLAAAEVKAGKYDTLQEAAFAQWKTWDIKDPILFMGNLSIAASRVAADVAFVDGFIVRAMREGFASSAAKKGWVKIGASGKTTYGDLFGMREVYFHPDIADVLHRIDNVATASTKFEGLFGKIVHEYIDVAADAWKYNITLPRPGHHFRNLWGDETMTYLAQGAKYFLSAGNKARQVLATRNDYPGVDLLLKKLKITRPEDLASLEGKDIAKMLANLGQDVSLPVPKPGEILINKNSMTTWSRSLTHDDIYKLAMEYGILTDPVVAEGLFGDSVRSGRFSKFIEYFSRGASLGIGTRGGDLEQIIMGISQYRDHYSRLHHFIQYIEQAQAGQKMTRSALTEVHPQSFQEMIELAAERVNKYHPDNSNLSPEEMKFNRRLLMFYGWTRGAVQAFAEATMTAPARITAFNKASYGLAESLGINPHSITDPFPQDQLFPSFFQEEVQGPQFEAGGRYYGFSPGIAPWDIQNMLTGSPTEISMGALNPVMRLPLELLTGTNLGTGSRIRDYSDQIDSSIPGVNYFSNISTYSVTGSIVSLLSGKGLDKQLQYELGNKGFLDQLISGGNWLTGAGLRDYSRPSYIRFAKQELEQKNNPDQRGF